MLNSPVAHASAAHRMTPVKTLPEALWRLDVVCRSCTEALPRLFGLLAQHGLIPATIDYRKGSDGFAIGLTVAPADARIAALLTSRIEQIVTVTQVSIRQCDHL